MFRSKKSNVGIALPDPPTVEAILEDLQSSGPDDIVFTLDLSDPQKLIGATVLPKRFGVRWTQQLDGLLYVN